MFILPTIALVHMKHFSIVLLLLSVFIAMTFADPFVLKDGDVVAFVGGTDMVRMQRDAKLETALTVKYLAAKPRFRDLAWDGDTVYYQGTVRDRWRKDAFGGWEEQLKRVGATVVIVQFGKMESLDGPDGIDDFTNAYAELLNTLSKSGRRVIVLAPARFEWATADASHLPIYAKAAERLATSRGLPFIAGDPVDAVGETPSPERTAAVREKHRLWYDYWRPANWKCLYGDDGKRIFSNAVEGLPSFEEEWETFPELVAGAEAAIFAGSKIVPHTAPARTGSGEANIAKELASFEVDESYEVNLFADESHGIANPLSIRWGIDGTAYVACSDVYPQIEPGVLPDDKVMALRDENGDGHCDESAVFVRGLSIPTGMEVAHDGVYVGHNTELVHVDWNGDRRTVLSGFGNGDSHQTINGFAWSPGGELWLCQGDGIESRVETPYGVSGLFMSGTMRLRTETLELHGFLDGHMGPGNPWGIIFDDYGQAFVCDGAGGISHMTPGTVPTKRRRLLDEIGEPGGYCGIECLDNGEFLLGDYKKNQVSRFVVEEDGAGYKVAWREPILRSRHRNFRPVDVKQGPDGAIYVVDWYNPITCHQDDFYRHPERDKTHGRIWRIAPKSGAQSLPNLADASIDQLLEHLTSDRRWIRLKAKQTLAAKDRDQASRAVKQWAIDRTGRDLVEALGMLEWIESPDGSLTKSVLQANDHRVRAYAARVIGRWGMRLESALELLQVAASDPHPLVRMEAVLSAAAIPQADSVLVAAWVATFPQDKWLRYAFSQSVHHLSPLWAPSLKNGTLDFGDNRAGMAAVLAEADSKALLADVRQVVSSSKADGTTRSALLATLATLGDEDDVSFVLNHSPPAAEALRALATHERPQLGFEPKGRLGEILRATEPDVQRAALDLIAAWQVNECADLVVMRLDMATGRDAAIRALGALKHKPAIARLSAIAADEHDPDQTVAIAALLEIDPDKATQSAANLLATTGDRDKVNTTLSAFLTRESTPALLLAELERREVAPGQGTILRDCWIASGLVHSGLASF
ncbi:MAG: HEAT repeat domain-containing protein, partial [Verrucomicrobia bacterium]|nr:HEAT repeat domain-containing protein [Verrucomicrobiota bacterium]